MKKMMLGMALVLSVVAVVLLAYGCKGGTAVPEKPDLVATASKTEAAGRTIQTSAAKADDNVVAARQAARESSTNIAAVSGALRQASPAAAPASDRLDVEARGLNEKVVKPLDIAHESLKEVEAQVPVVATQAPSEIRQAAEALNTMQETIDAKDKEIAGKEREIAAANDQVAKLKADQGSWTRGALHLVQILALVAVAGGAALFWFVDKRSGAAIAVAGLLVFGLAVFVDRWLLEIAIGAAVLLALSLAAAVYWAYKNGWLKLSAYSSAEAIKAKLQQTAPAVATDLLAVLKTVVHPAAQADYTQAKESGQVPTPAPAATAVAAVTTPGPGTASVKSPPPAPPINVIADGSVPDRAAPAAVGAA
jgi:hypothetical protein